MPAETEATIWGDDKLDRRADATFLIQFLKGRIEEKRTLGLPRSYVLNLDARWGEGKTFFLDRLGRTLKAQGYIVAQVNAWRDDQADDPLLSVMSAIDASLSELVKDRNIARDWSAVQKTGARIALAAAKGTAIHLLSKVMGEGANEVASIAAGAMQEAVGSLIDDSEKELLARFEQGRKSISGFSDQLATLLRDVAANDRPLPMFVLIDELDRCRPPYAIALIERVKHLFDTDGVVFLVATDTEQLQHSIGAVYGANFDSKRYLQRFFDRTYTFEMPTRDQLIRQEIASKPLDEGKVNARGSDLADFVADGFEAHALSTRDCLQCYDIVRSVVSMWTLPVPLELLVLLPLAIGFQRKLSPEITKGFADRLHQAAVDKGGSPRDWRIGTWVSDGKRVEIIVDEVFRYVIDACDRPLLQWIREDHKGGPSELINGMFNDEISRVYKGTYRDGSFRSILTQYPRFVRSAGRLAPSTN